jgi:hypothetical protein
MSDTTNDSVDPGHARPVRAAREPFVHRDPRTPAGRPKRCTAPLSSPLVGANCHRECVHSIRQNRVRSAK